MVFSLMAGDAQRGEWGFQLKVDICGQGESRARQNVNIRLISRTLIKTMSKLLETLQLIKKFLHSF